ncbi:sphingomyelin phosphodiesterase, putative [Plasmodium malariae]|uniref:Sphingomyelin phosphodiesterase, putative n=1 Tax=Plasmodium malariae TaxID=5858 RepID=A0A1A8WJ04_PLAMA|nr:sphingomyelin phosphodiesterase, putative [Plasmodium malariae]
MASNSLTIMSYNIQMLSIPLSHQLNIRKRGNAIVDYILYLDEKHNMDILVLNEVFTHKSYRLLTSGLIKERFPYHTNVLGKKFKENSKHHEKKKDAQNIKKEEDKDTVTFGRNRTRLNKREIEDKDTLLFDSYETHKSDETVCMMSALDSEPLEVIEDDEINHKHNNSLNRIINNAQGIYRKSSLEDMLIIDKTINDCLTKNVNLNNGNKINDMKDDRMSLNNYWEGNSSSNNNNNNNNNKISMTDMGEEIVLGEEVSNEKINTKMHNQKICNFDSISGKSKFYQFLNGGVIVLSKHKILHNHALIFSNSKFPDMFCTKGAIYLQCDVNNKKVNVIATHLQAGDTIEQQNCRWKQLNELRTWLYKGIPSNYIKENEPLFFVGDLNIRYNMDKFFLDKVLSNDCLNCSVTKDSLETTYDSFLNDYCRHMESDYTYKHNHTLDYILVSNDSKVKVIVPQTAIQHEYKPIFYIKSFLGFIPYNTTYIHHPSDHFPIYATFNFPN